MKSKSLRIIRSKGFTTLSKLILFGAVFAYLSSKGLISVEATTRAFTHWPYLLASLGILFLNLLLSFIRWQLLLKAQGIHFSLFRTIELGMVGFFFNTALPGAVSGDFVKAFYVGKEAQGMRGTAFASILFDRVVGLSALVLVSSAALILNLDVFWGSPLLSAIKVLLISSGSGVVFFYAYLFLVSERRDPVLWSLKRLENRTRITKSVLNLYQSIRSYHQCRWTVTKALLLSAVMQMNAAGIAYLLAIALGEPALPLLSLFVVVPLGLLATAVPLLPGGVGTGHAAYTWGFLLLNSSRGADVFNLQFLLNLILSAIGGLVYLRFKSHQEGMPLSPYAQPEVN